MKLEEELKKRIGNDCTINTYICGDTVFLFKGRADELLDNLGVFFLEKEVYAIKNIQYGGFEISILFD